MVTNPKHLMLSVWSILIGGMSRPVVARALAALTLLILARLSSVFSPLAFKGITDSLVQITPYVHYNQQIVSFNTILYSFIFLSLRFLTPVMNGLRDVIYSKVVVSITEASTISGFIGVCDMPLQTLMQMRIGSIIRLVDRSRLAVEELSRLVGLTLIPLLFEILLVITVIGVTLGPFYLSIVSLTVVMYIAFTIIAMERRQGLREELSEADSNLSGVTSETVSNIITVRAFLMSWYEKNRFVRAISRYSKIYVHSQNSIALINVVQSLIFSAGFALVTVIAIRDVIGNKMSVGDFVFLNMILTQLYTPLDATGMVYKFVKHALIDVNLIEKMGAKGVDGIVSEFMPDTRIGLIEDADFGRVKGVRFENVSVVHDEKQILGGISFHVPLRSTVGIIGHSGSGKTTIAKLLAGIIEPNTGSIEIDGVPISSIDRQTGRHIIGLVSQEPNLFNETISYNIAYGSPTATQEDIYRVTKKAGISDMIELMPEGINTIVGEKGMRLSGGERQRIAIARMYLWNPSILILDEVTSALDAITEKKIWEALTGLIKDKTTIIISHKLENVMDADSIIVLEKGVIKERGTHASLIRSKGIYKSLWISQHDFTWVRR